MSDIINKSSSFRADQMLMAAERELLRSSDDTVPFLICKNARNSIQNHLTGFLIGKGKEFVADASLIQLVNQCREIDERFNEIDMEHLYCNNEPHGNNFCTDLKKVEACVEVARNIRDLVHLEPWPLSRRVK